MTIEQNRLLQERGVMVQYRTVEQMVMTKKSAVHKASSINGLIYTP